MAELAGAWLCRPGKGVRLHPESSRDPAMLLEPLAAPERMDYKVLTLTGFTQVIITNN